jgi:hypothetical protein
MEGIFSRCLRTRVFFPERVGRARLRLTLTLDARRGAAAWPLPVAARRAADGRLADFLLLEDFDFTFISAKAHGGFTVGDGRASETKAAKSGVQWESAPDGNRPDTRSGLTGGGCPKDYLPACGSGDN